MHIMNTLRRLSLLTSAALVCATPAAFAQATLPPAPVSAPIDLKFDFSAGPAKPGYTRVAPTALYADAAGYGY